MPHDAVFRGGDDALDPEHPARRFEARVRHEPVHLLCRFKVEYPRSPVTTIITTINNVTIGIATDTIGIAKVYAADITKLNGFGIHVNDPTFAFACARFHCVDVEILNRTPVTQPAVRSSSSR